MQQKLIVLTTGLLLLAAAPASAQVTGGVLYVNNTHMSWWGGVARDATARQYDVDANLVVLDKKAGTISFQAKKGRLADLDQLHESIWATRLGDGTGMELKWLDVTAEGEVAVLGKEVKLKVRGSEHVFLLGDEDSVPTLAEKQAFNRLREALDRGEKVVSVTGRVEGWTGNLTKFSKVLPGKPRRILVKDFRTAKP